MQPLVYIVVLNWNGHQDTMRCVASLERQVYGNYRILIVDNGSTDGSVEVLKGLWRTSLIDRDSQQSRLHWWQQPRHARSLRPRRRLCVAVQ